VHAHIDELKTLNEDIKKKMWLYHYQPGKKPDAEKMGFAGYIKKGQTFAFGDLVAVPVDKVGSKEES
jgi:hypothetical protein